MLRREFLTGLAGLALGCVSPPAFKHHEGFYMGDDLVHFQEQTRYVEELLQRYCRKFTHTKEEAYFVIEIPQNPVASWHDISTFRKVMQVGYDGDAIKKILTGYQDNGRPIECAQYHIHTLYSLIDYWRKKGPKRDMFFSVDAIDTTLVPSANDIVNAIEVDELTAHLAKDMSWRVVGPTGVYSYSAEPYIESYLAKHGKEHTTEYINAAITVGTKQGTVDDVVRNLEIVGVNLSFERRGGFMPLIVREDGTAEFHND